MQMASGSPVYACNKYRRCLTYEEMQVRLKDVTHEMMTYRSCLEDIVRINAMDYEYKAWAKGSLDKWKLEDT